ncbi:MAG TPA: protein kinase [Polyangiaceae bacterium]|jgi:serine/threonine-protein kinase|nr:protein kinase [Polyangiaceae bacterium]
MAEDVFGIVGSVIAGAYHVERVVAEGGFGVVYRAHHGGFRAPVALKLLKVPPQSSEQQSAFLELFRAEAELSFRLAASLPTVVRPLHVDAFTAYDGRFVPYIVLEWLDGMTLDELIKQRNRDGAMPLPLRRLVRLLTPVARALERAHNFTSAEGRVSIVHRDLKPENIFIAEVAGEEVVKILDFGIGKVKSAASQVAGRMSQDGQAPAAFTPAYGAPEQWAPKQFGQTGPWTDVWGLALCMVEVLAGRPVIDGDPAAMMVTALDPRRRPTPRTEGVDLPDAAEEVFLRALALDPRQRQRDAGVFWNELLAAIEVPVSERGLALQRDARVEAGGGVRVERVDVRSRSSGSMSRVPQPTAAVERALAMDLEFDPMSARAARPGAVSETRPSTPAPPAPAQAMHFVPDLELAPPPVSRKPSGMLAAATATAPSPVLTPQPMSAVSPASAHTSGAHAAVLDFDETPSQTERAAVALDLDLPADEPIARRAASTPGMRAVQLPAPESNPRPNRSSEPPAPMAVPVSGVMPVRVETVEFAASPPSAREPSTREARPSVPPLSPRNASATEPKSVAKVAFALAEEKPLLTRLRPALVLLGLSIALAIFDPTYAALTGEKLEILGARPSLFGGALLLVALALAGREVFREP